MRISALFVAMSLALGFSQISFADHHEDGGKHCTRHHKMQDADTNKDGAISRDEFMAGHQAMADKMFSKMDANSDGKIDEAERTAGKEKMGKHCDRKGDAKLYQ